MSQIRKNVVEEFISLNPVKFRLDLQLSLVLELFLELQHGIVGLHHKSHLKDLQFLICQDAFELFLKFACGDLLGNFLEILMPLMDINFEQPLVLRNNSCLLHLLYFETILTTL